MDLANILRSAITASGMTQLALSKETGVPQQRISAFLRGGDMKLRHAGALMEVTKIRRECLKLMRERA